MPPTLAECFGAPENSPVAKWFFDEMKTFPKHKFGSHHLKECISLVPSPLMFVYGGHLHFLKLTKCKPKFMNQIHTLEATKNKPLSLLFFVVINID